MKLHNLATSSNSSLHFEPYSRGRGAPGAHKATLYHSIMGVVGDCLSLAKWSLKSRAVLLLLQVSDHIIPPSNQLCGLLQVVVHNVIPDHSGSMEDVFMKTYRSPDHPVVIERLLGGFDNWDAEYFIFNAHSGYSRHEETMAFFPLLPTAMCALGNTLLLPLGLLLPQRSILLISGVLINLVAFPLAVIALYLLVYELSHSRTLSTLAAALFSLNPASVFMSAVYSETLFSLFTFSGLLALERKWAWLSCLLFSLATATRSNGMVLCGFVGYRFLSDTLEILFSECHRHDTHTTTTCQRMWVCVKSVCATAIQCLIIITPFCLFQLYGYSLYCGSGGHTPSPVWCGWSLPIPYSYIQEHYWNNGFLRYYQLKQLPNFLLAGPMVLLVMMCVTWYLTAHASPIRTPKESRIEHGVARGLPKESRTEHGVARGLPKESRTEHGVARGTWSVCVDRRLRPYVVHMLFLMMFAMANMHVQVRGVVREVSACVYAHVHK